MTTYTWDYENRLQAIAMPGAGVVTNTYGIDGLRRMREQASDTVPYVWDSVGRGTVPSGAGGLSPSGAAGSRLLLEADGSLMTHALYTSSPAGFGPTISQHRDNASAFYHPDHLGTVWNLTNTSGTVTDTYLFDAWGNQLSGSGSTVNPHRYVGALGYQTEPSLGLDYIRARWLRPGTGSWLSVDPVQGEERYGYVRGWPTAGGDPSGRMGALAYDLQASWIQARIEGLKASIAESESRLERVRAGLAGQENLAPVAALEAQTAYGQAEGSLEGLYDAWAKRERQLDALRGSVTYRETALEVARIYVRTNIVTGERAGHKNWFEEVLSQWGITGENPDSSVAWCAFAISQFFRRARDPRFPELEGWVNDIYNMGVEAEKHGLGSVVTVEDPEWSTYIPRPGDIAIFGKGYGAHIELSRSTG